MATRTPHGRSLRYLLIVAGLVGLRGAAPGKDPENPPAPTGRRTIQTARGVQIDLRFDPARASDEEILAALEEAAQALRRPVPPPPCPVPAAGEPETAPVAVLVEPPVPADAASVDGLYGMWWRGVLITTGPSSLLWQPPLANQHEPRMAVKLTTLEYDKSKNIIDTSIGATFGFLRFSGEEPSGLVVQQDFFAVARTRFAHLGYQVAADYSFGFPLTAAWGPWHGKFGFEHTSTHQGDRDLLKFGRRDQLVRNELVLGAGRFLGDQWRVYGVAGYAVSLSAARKVPSRYDWGVEWYGRGPTGFCGRPFAAFDMDLRGEQGYEPGVTAQVGWYWGQMGRRMGALRTVLEYYDGKSPFGGFQREREHWFGVGLAVDY